MPNFDHFFAVIMAGGGGTRLWPLSTKKMPKQMVKIFGDDTLFQIAVKRLEGLFPPERIFVVTVADQAEILASQSPKIPLENFLIEPFPKGTASVVGYAATFIQHLDPDAIISVLTADHFIKNVNEFQNLLKAAYLAATESYLITLGIQPTYAATGYGYIHKGDPVKQYLEKWAFKVNKFIEKPDNTNANLMFSSGGYDWNSGMFIWHVNSILDEIKKQMPDLYSILEDIKKLIINGSLSEDIEMFWKKIVPQTIDYGIMENAENVIVLPGSNLGWFDVGSWESLFDVLDTDDHDNLIMAENVINVDTNKTLIYSNSGDKLIATLGVTDLVIVDTGNVLLVCERKKSQEIKNIVKYLAENEMVDYL